MMKRPFTLAEIERQRLLVDKGRRELEAGIKEDVAHLFAPMPSGSKLQSWINNAERAIAVYDGVMLGFKFFRQFRGMFHRKRK